MRRFTSPLIVVFLLGSLSALAESTPAKPAALKTVAVDGAPKAIGPYSQGVIANGFLYTAGQVPRDPKTGNLVEGDITIQTNRVFDNLEAVLKGAGCTFADVVKATVFMTDLARLREDERSLRQAIRRQPPRPVDRSGREAADGRHARNRPRRARALTVPAGTTAT